ncbi:MAG: dTMP kinase [Pseudomonadota bacterium]
MTQSPTPRGVFVSVEGIDGAGKSTQARLLAARLRALGHAVVLTREPGGSAGAEAIRALVLGGETARWSPMTEALLFTAARRDHVERTIAPALAAGEIVLCDRFIDSTRAYQGDDPALAETVEMLHRRTIGLDPELTLIFDLDPEAAASRRASRTEDRIEARGLAFQQALRARFLALAEAEPDRIAVIQADATEATVADRVWAVAAPRLGLG